MGMIVRDRTNLKELEKKIKEQTDFIKSINENANMIVMKLKPDGTILSLNRKGKNVAGYDSNEVIGKNWLSTFFISEDQKILEEISAKGFQTKRAKLFTGALKTKSGEQRIISWTSSAIHNERRKVVEIILFGVDITSERLLQEEIKRSEEKYRALFESSKDTICAIDLEGKFFAANSGSYELTGYKAEELIGRNHLFLFHKDDKNRVDYYFRQSAHGEVTDFEARLVKKDGRIVDLSIKDSPIYQGGEIIGVYGAGRDVTEKKKADERIARMNRWASLGQLSAGIAHEIRNPLSGLNLNIDILARQASNNPKNREVIKDIKTAVNRIEHTVRNILDFAQPKSSSLRTVSLDSLIESSYNLLKTVLNHHNVTAIFQLAARLPPLQVDPYQVEQALINIILNAKDAMPNGGVIRIVTELIDNRKTIMLLINDTGAGISEENLPRIFEPFYTTKNKGTGLGLAIACRNLEQYGATIEVTSKRRSGTTFIIKFPLSESV